jgi:hypothetical protein
VVGGAMTQLERAVAARKKLLDLFPQIVEAKDELGRVLEAAQNPPPQGEADGTINELKFQQLASIKKSAQGLLGSLLFWSEAP